MREAPVPRKGKTFYVVGLNQCLDVETPEFLHNQSLPIRKIVESCFEAKSRIVCVFGGEGEETRNIKFTSCLRAAIFLCALYLQDLKMAPLSLLSLLVET